MKPEDRAHSASNPSINTVLHLLSRGISANPNEDISQLPQRHAFLSQKIVGQRPAPMPEGGWQALATAFSLPCVDKPTQLIKLADILIPKQRTESLSHESSAALHRCLDTVACNHGTINFRELSSLFKFLVTLSRHDDGKGHKSINAIERALVADTDHYLKFPSLLNLASGYLDLPTGTSSEHAEAFRRRVRIALSTDDIVTDLTLGRFYLETSPLPEAQRTVISNDWQRAGKGFVGSHLVTKQVASAIADLQRINEHFARAQGSQSNPESIAKAISCHLAESGEISRILMPAPPQQPLSGADSKLVLDKLAAGATPAAVAHLVKLAQQTGVTLAEVPNDLSATSPAIQRPLVDSDGHSRAQGSAATESRQKRLTILSPVSHVPPALFVPDDSDEVMSALQSLLSPGSAEGTWNAELAILFARRCATKSEGVVQEKDRAEFSIACYVHERLISSGHTSEEALRVSWAYSTHKRFRVSELREVTDSLFGPSPKEAFTVAMRQLAADSDISDVIFRRALRFAAKAFPETWEPLRALYSSVGLATLVTLDDLRSFMAQSNKSTPHELQLEIMRAAEVRQVAQTRADLITYLQSSDRDARELAAKNLNDRYRVDLGPYPQFIDADSTVIYPPHQQMVEEVSRIYRGCFGLHYGFGHSTFECRTPPTASDWMLIRFAIDSATSVFRLNSSASDRFPGPGCILSGLKLERIFAANPATPNDPYSHFKSAWPWAAQELDDLGYTKFLGSRGVKAIMPPSGDKYCLDGVHYSLVVWNENFLNPNLDAAALVPTAVLQVALRGKTSRIDTPGQRPIFAPEQSIHDDALTLPALAAASAARGLNLLNLGWVSNIGGLANAYPPFSKPLFEWEKERIFHPKDRAGHVLKSHINGRATPIMSQETDRLLQPIRDAHKRVYGLSSALLTLHDLFSVSLSVWHKGCTAPEEDHFRMLREAFLWNKLHAQGITDRNEFPVLCVTNTFDSWSMVRSPLVLDTFDLTLKVANGSSFRFSPRSGGDGGHEMTVWDKFAKPLCFSDWSSDLRFLDRRSVDYVPTSAS